MLKNKRLISLLAAVLFSLLLGVVGYLIGSNLNETFNRGNSENDFTYLPKINHEQFKAKLENGETFYLYIGRPDCGDSRQFNKEFEQIFVEFNQNGEAVDIYYNIDNKNFYYFDVSEIIDAISDTEIRLQYKDLYGFYFTPTLIAYTDLNGDGISEVKNIAEWNPDYGYRIGDYMKWFYENDLVKPYEKVYHQGESIKN